MTGPPNGSPSHRPKPEFDTDIPAWKRTFYEGDWALTQCFLYNDQTSTSDEDVLILINKALADMGALA